MFQRVSPCSESRSRMEEMMTMLYFLASYKGHFLSHTKLCYLHLAQNVLKCHYLKIEKHTLARWRVVGPLTASSANWVQGCFSRVQKAKGIATDNKSKKKKINLLRMMTLKEKWSLPAHSRPLGDSRRWYRTWQQQQSSQKHDRGWPHTVP